MDRYQHLGDMMSLGAVNGAVTLPLPLPPPLAGALQGGLLGSLAGAAGVKVDSSDDSRRITLDGANKDDDSEEACRLPTLRIPIGWASRVDSSDEGDVGHITLDDAEWSCSVVHRVFLLVSIELPKIMQ